MAYPSNFLKFPTFSMCNNQLVINQPKTNKMAANDGNLNLQFRMYRRFFNVNTGNGIKNFESDAGGA